MAFQWIRIESVQTVGYLGSQLYKTGWHNALHNSSSGLSHLLLSSFFYYRKGFAAASDWAQLEHLEKTRQ